METQTTVIFGGFLVPNDTHIGKWQKETGRLDHDAFLPACVVSRLKIGDCVIDCGAFDGDHTIAYSKAVGDFGLVLAIEAGDLAHQCLVHNISLFPVKNVIPFHAAVGQADGFTVFHSPDENLGASTCVPLITDDSKAIKTICIDSLSKNLDRKINFIKMDIEGWEMFALRGAEAVIHRSHPEMLIEINRGALEKNRSTPNDIVEYVEAHGYEWKIVQPYCKFSDPQFDILCTPK